jgi:hypothetical protein
MYLLRAVYGTIFRITGGFLNAATITLKRVSKKQGKTWHLIILAIMPPKFLKNHKRIYRKCCFNFIGHLKKIFIS